MGAFDALRIAGSGLGMHQTWLDALGHNIANVNDITSTDEAAFQAQLLTAGAREDGGVQVTGIALSSAEGRLVHMPDHPLADADGYVRAPDMDMESQMSELIMAQRGFQASAQVTKYAQDTYGTAIQIGK
ncbi:flagellar basal body rod protein FlgC [Nocardioides bruguierae]|uniref:Flagellar basal-body rod protein FlgC n=1 Tax=Nocardioides bruguierae TaxID=2945102 RepID=A0A9X2IHG2_9ACTN|nr:flagellar basal body rod C-terminal domain-containing protein [Nocardioides bruguierae]MCL8027702.1 flagellar basal-body rod protein FlgC [Nocardioides bruguierae]MCM0622569.1 flagellar basal-body rod protein FlgC [Nocardioides bruguierae]